MGIEENAAEYIGQYGVRFAGTDGGLLQGCTIIDTFSDLVGVTANNPALKDRNITIVDNVLERSTVTAPRCMTASTS